jgi:uncharacterized protein (TIGR02118 family)
MPITPGRSRLAAASGDLSRRSVIVGLAFGGIATALAAAGWRVDTHAQDATPAVDMMPTEELNALVVVYGHPTDPAAFQGRLHNSHIPLVWEVPGVQEIVIHSSMAGLDGTAGDIYQLGTVIFASQAEMQEALVSEQAQVALVDLADFATGGFTAYLTHFESRTRPDESGTPEASPPA